MNNATIKIGSKVRANTKNGIIFGIVTGLDSGDYGINEQYEILSPNGAQRLAAVTSTFEISNEDYNDLKELVFG